MADDLPPHPPVLRRQNAYDDRQEEELVPPHSPVLRRQNARFLPYQINIDGVNRDVFVLVNGQYRNVFMGREGRPTLNETIPGGRRKKQRGGRVSMPIQYFGGELNRYFPAGSPELNPLPSAYGTTIARSFGTYDPKLLQLNAVAPNLGPMGLGSHGENMSCGVQTGGKRKNTKRNRKQKRNTKKH